MDSDLCSSTSSEYYDGIACSSSGSIGEMTVVVDVSNRCDEMKSIANPPATVLSLFWRLCMCACDFDKKIKLWMFPAYVSTKPKQRAVLELEVNCSSSNAA